MRTTSFEMVKSTEEPTHVRQLQTRSGSVLPPIVLGTAALGSVDPTGLFGRRARAEAFSLLDHAYDRGCRVFDLARSYKLGGTDRVVGDWLRATGVRDEVFLAYKIGHPLPLVAPFRLDSSSLLRDMHSALRDLGTESVDLLMVHRDHPDVSLTDLARTLVRLRDDGHTRFTGVSNWTYDRIVALEAVSDRPVVQASSPQFSLTEWKSPPWRGSTSISGRKHRYERGQYGRARLPVFAYCALGQGSASARGGRFGGPRSFRHEANAARLGRAQKLARVCGVSVAQIALAYLLCQPFPVFAIVGVRTKRRIEENLAVTRIALTPDQVRWLDDGRVRDGMLQDGSHRSGVSGE